MLHRSRRNRKATWIRNILSEINLTSNDLIMPIFITDGKNQKQPIKSLPGVYRYSIDQAAITIKQAKENGINAFCFFPNTPNDKKTLCAKESYNSNNLICNTIKHVKDKVPDIGVICDIALDPYTTHGHDGILENGEILNDKTVEILTKQALCVANAGCDVVAPSDMMDGRILKIRTALEDNNFHNINILSYSAKFASNFYGPFRDAIGSSNKSGKIDKSTYQLDYHNKKMTLMRMQQDIDEGADILMVKPGLPYLDILKSASDNYDIPIFAYQVSGEYAMIKLAAENGCLNYERAMYETLICFKRSGASAILTYGALDIAQHINK